MAPGRKAVIRATEAVNYVRSGMSDTALMRVYSISAKGLESLFRKLVAAGLIDEAELERRMITSTLSHIVDLDSYAPSAPEKNRVRIQTSEAVRLIQSGTGDIALMERFGISTRGLDSLFRKLAAADAISQEDLDERKHAAQWAEVAFIDMEESYPEPVEDSGAGLRPDRWSIVTAIRKHRMPAGVMLGFFVGVSVSVSAYFWLPALVPIRGQVRVAGANHPEVAPATTLELEAEHLIKVLESITRDGSLQAKVDGTSTRSAFQECLKNCDKEFPDPDETDRMLLFNCKKACIVEFSDRVKKLRQRYYGAVPK